ncbi:MAG: Holliday junction branch migration protein RuvA [Kyrpidia sp.]|nr:Holliday junction branch migration protein RuvA [Kyrpidia sp.]
MITFLRGQIASVGTDHVVVDVQGVGYKVFVTGRFAAGMRPGQGVILHTQLVWREDGPVLYGFSDPRERDFFVLLQGVPGIGPKVAIGVVAAGMDAVARAVTQEDLAFLRRLPGVGRKTAERMVVDLRDKLTRIADQDDLSTPKDPESGRPLGDVIAALSSLGYNEKEIQSVMPELRREWKEGRKLDDMIRLALSRLARG